MPPGACLTLARSLQVRLPKLLLALSLVPGSPPRPGVGRRLTGISSISPQDEEDRWLEGAAHGATASSSGFEQVVAEVAAAATAVLQRTQQNSKK